MEIKYFIQIINGLFSLTFYVSITLFVHQVKFFLSTSKVTREWQYHQWMVCYNKNNVDGYFPNVIKIISDDCVMSQLLTSCLFYLFCVFYIYIQHKRNRKKIQEYVWCNFIEYIYLGLLCRGNNRAMNLS